MTSGVLSPEYGLCAYFPYSDNTIFCHPERLPYSGVLVFRGLGAQGVDVNLFCFKAPLNNPPPPSIIKPDPPELNYQPVCGNQFQYCRERGKKACDRSSERERERERTCNYCNPSSMAERETASTAGRARVRGLEEKLTGQTTGREGQGFGKLCFISRGTPKPQI